MPMVAQCPTCRAVFDVATGETVKPGNYGPGSWPSHQCPRCERDPGARVPDTIPAPEVHPVRADVLVAWENGLPFQDTTENERAVYEFLAYLARKESHR